MPIDKVKPLKLENGSEIDFGPTEVDPTEDYVSAKGIAIENNDNYLVDVVGRIVRIEFPFVKQVLSFNPDGSINIITYYNSNTVVNANRIADAQLTYSGGDPSTEVLRIYGSNGITVVKTYTTTYTYLSGNLESTSLTET